jgi:hypothetical protein
MRSWDSVINAGDSPFKADLRFKGIRPLRSFSLIGPRPASPFPAHGYVQGTT